MIELARELLDAEARVKELEDEVKRAKEVRDGLNDALAERMTDEEVQSLNVSGRMLYLRPQVYASYKKEIEDVFFDALEGHGYGAIIKPTVNSRTLTASVRELIEENDGQLPRWLEGMVDVFTQTKVAIKKS